ncbi:uncharacterized protein MELLADRAFT_89768 [Melampsora larici-populina 98AG31]|uniref:Uncharacterized protein n=1 Tax=Melampsora larici-populina (strain 98AG31 / pathotype 3-4-7) TaxID=747676 RepID=F4RUJ7_MELLP|nr:uncharacterized protein MELLADRAFT_89768 [Melampsora larici-populina 98AG31]EGG03984.1 hypothetical protein MELLADRAFT_89768 [Melampsora larici-populina 98AG31]
MRYSTKQHRLTALDFRAKHKNERGRHKAVVNSLKHLRQTQKKMDDANKVLKDLNTTHGHTEMYFQQQWERKKAIQGQTISQTSKDYLEHVGDLVELEEKLVIAQDQLEDLHRRSRRQRRRHRRRNHRSRLPNTLVLLERAIEEVSDRLGDAQLIELTGTSDARAQPLIKIRVAKGNLLGAKASVIEHQRQASHARATAAQLRRKHATYWRLANDYNIEFQPDTPLDTPSLQEVEAMPLKPWAIDDATQEGIEAYITICRCQEELRRIAKEARQMVCWAVEYQDKINELRRDTINDLSSFATDVIPNWTSKDVMMSLTSTVARQADRIWLRWNQKILFLLDATANDNVCKTFSDAELKAKWRSMVQFTLQEWERMVRIQNILAGEEELDQRAHQEDDGKFDDDNLDIEEFNT